LAREGKARRSRKRRAELGSNASKHHHLTLPSYMLAILGLLRKSQSQLQVMDYELGVNASPERHTDCKMKFFR